MGLKSFDVGTFTNYFAGRLMHRYRIKPISVNSLSSKVGNIVANVRASLQTLTLQPVLA